MRLRLLIYLFFCIPIIFSHCGTRDTPEAKAKRDRLDGGEKTVRDRCIELENALEL